jgi:hypothetical protein
MVHIKRINEMANITPNYQTPGSSTLVWRNQNIAIVGDDNEFITIMENHSKLKKRMTIHLITHHTKCITNIVVKKLQ